MNVYQSILINILYVFIAVNISLCLVIYYNIYDLLETSFIAGFLFLLINRIFIQIERLNTLYNNLNYKIIYK